MIFAVLFVMAFLTGLALYWLTGKWLWAVIISMGLFVLSTFSDSSASDQWGITLIFGLPIVFFASLLGAYVVQQRQSDDAVDEQE